MQYTSTEGPDQTGAFCNLMTAFVAYLIFWNCTPHQTKKTLVRLWVLWVLIWVFGGRKGYTTVFSVYTFSFIWAPRPGWAIVITSFPLSFHPTTPLLLKQDYCGSQDYRFYKKIRIKRFLSGTSWQMMLQFHRNNLWNHPICVCSKRTLPVVIKNWTIPILQMTKQI